MALRNYYRCLNYWFVILYITYSRPTRIDAFITAPLNPDVTDASYNVHPKFKVKTMYNSLPEFNNDNTTDKLIKQNNTIEGEHNGINNENESRDDNLMNNKLKYKTTTRPKDNTVKPDIGITEYVSISQFLDSTLGENNHLTSLNTEFETEKNNENIATKEADDTNTATKIQTTTELMDFLVGNIKYENNTDKHDWSNSVSTEAPPIDVVLNNDTKWIAATQNYSTKVAKITDFKVKTREVDEQQATMGEIASDTFAPTKETEKPSLSTVNDINEQVSESIKSVSENSTTSDTMSNNMMQETTTKSVDSKDKKTDLSDVSLSQEDENEKPTTMVPTSQIQIIDKKYSLNYPSTKQELAAVSETTNTATLGTELNTNTYTPTVSNTNTNTPTVPNTTSERITAEIITERGPTNGSLSSTVTGTVLYDQNIITKPNNSLRSLLLTVNQEDPIITFPGTTDTIISTVLSTKRGGFLDITQELAQEVLTDDNKKEIAGGSVDTEHKPYIELSKDDVVSITIPINDAAADKSQSPNHLVDDAYKEDELLMEKTILNIQDLQTQTSSNNHTVAMKVENHLTTEDQYSVKPINKNSLYAVNPNYKPLKKLEISSPKPLFKHPDDNSWRNESISSLGIVFKPLSTNSSKPLTQVLKIKSSTAALNEMAEKEDKDAPDLRERLEKLGEKRKYKKKKPGSEDNYVEYEEYIPFSSTTQTPETTSISTLNDEPPGSTHTTSAVYINTATEEPEYATKTIESKHKKQKNIFNAPEYEEEEFTTSIKAHVTSKPQDIQQSELTTGNTLTTLFHSYFYMPTAVTEYIPKLLPKKTPGDIFDFNRKINQFTIVEETTTTSPYVSISTKSYRLTSTLLKSNSPRVSQENQDKKQDVGVHAHNYVIKNFKDMLDHASKDEFDRAKDFVHKISDTPFQGVTPHRQRTTIPNYEDYDYGPQNIKLKPLPPPADDIPVIYNNSVIHSIGDRLASSNAFIKQYYNADKRVTRPPTFYFQQTKGYDPSCEKMTVELSPAYELHYYVPEQEETQALDKTSSGFYSNFQIAGRWQ